MMKILQLCVYPTTRPQHGGQIRAYQMKLMLEKLGYEVLTLSVSGTGHIEYHDQNDLIIDFSMIPKFYGLDCFTDVLIAQICSKDLKIIKFLEQHLVHFKPDVILLEHPWLWPFVKKMLQDKNIIRDKIHIIYSSHNVEFLTKEKTISDEDKCNVNLHTALDMIKTLEIDLVKNSNYVFCVTESDAECWKSLVKTKSLILRNGVAKRHVTQESMEECISLVGPDPFLLFSASAYIPNALGFWKLMGPSLANFPPNSKIVLISSLGHMLFRFEPKEAQLFSNVNRHILKPLGYVSENILAALISRSEGIILPITDGGGSNLKTAEAIASGKPVISTSVATRGFDFVNQLSNFIITDDPKVFSLTASNVVMNKIKLKHISEEEWILRNSVYWENALLPLESLMSEIRLKINTSNS